MSSASGVPYAALSIKERLRVFLLTSSCFLVVYSATNFITSLRRDVATSAFSFEQFIPLLPWMIIPYWSIDLFFVGAPFVCQTKGELQIFLKRVCFAIVVAGICFLLFPLRLAFDRPQLEGMFGTLFSVLSSFDKPHNLAPSLHIALRSILWMVYIPKQGGLSRRLLQVWFILIGVSTLFTWQHQLIDVITGQYLALFTLWLFPALLQDAEASSAIPARAVKASYCLSRRYALLSLVFVLGAIVTWPLGVLLLWVAIALSIVATGYALSGPCIFRKQAGTLARSTRWLLAPYLCGLYLSFRYYTVKREPMVTITPQLWFGRRLSEREARDAVRKGVRAVLDLTAEYDECPAFLALRYKNIQVLDLTCPALGQLEDAVKFIESGLQAGTVYVHCSLGLSRSAVVVAAYQLFKNRAMTVAEAVSMIQTAAPHSVLKEHHLAILNEFLQRRRG